MEKERLSRKLAVILHADVVGSTALVQKNEALAHERIQSAFDSFSQTITSYGGIAREIRGDALVAEFDRASDAVTAALAFQVINGETNSTLSDDIQPILRIGISLGEVIVADNTITGAGVVLAQRLEQLAESGGVVVQGSVSETVPSRMPFIFSSQGEQLLKGFEQPVRAFFATMKPGERLPAPETDLSSQDPELKGIRITEEPSIAVLPFTNMSNDPEQEFFSDGITEDIITELSKVSALMVIARNSTFIYKNKAVDVKQAGRDLGVSYVLEGSVRKSGSRVRVTAQLIDAATGLHTWAERYDRELVDLFAVQDEIMREVVSALDIQLLSGEQSRFWSAGTKNLQAWECHRQGWNLISGYRMEDHHEVIRLARKAVEFDPEYSSAWHLLAACYFHIEDNTRYPETERKQAKDQSRQYLQQALKYDPSNPDAYSLLAIHHLTSKEFDEAAISTNKAIEMAPNHANLIASSAIVLNKCGQSEIALEYIQKAMKLSPIYPLWYLLALGQVSRLLGNTEATINAYKEMINRDSDSIEGHVGLAGILAEINQGEAARTPAAEVIRINSRFSIAEYTGNLAYRDPNEVTRIADGLRKAGLPE